MFVGIDFGTTNSTLAHCDASGPAQLARFELDGRVSETFRSVLYFDAEARERGSKFISAGHAAIGAYLAGDGRGRFVQSLKSYLASRTFKSTNIFNKVYTLETLIAHIVQELRAAAKLELPSQVVVGRPVQFVNDDDDPEGDALAESRLRSSFLQAGFAEVHFALEPVAAAYHYESRLARDELVLIADFGGGTTDLCLVDVGPGPRELGARSGKRAVRATDGVALAGDAFDQRIIRHAVAPSLGLGSTYRVLGGDADVPKWLYSSLARWHLLSFLKSPKTLHLLEEIVANANDAGGVGKLHRIVEEDLGYALHQAVERAKIELTGAEESRLEFEAAELARKLRRAELERWIAPEVKLIGAALDRLIARAGVRPEEIDRVFMTGGTSLVPAVRKLFAARFGEAKLSGGDELTSVGRGLALVARDVFG